RTVRTSTSPRSNALAGAAVHTPKASPIAAVTTPHLVISFLPNGPALRGIAPEPASIGTIPWVLRDRNCAFGACVAIRGRECPRQRAESRGRCVGPNPFGDW